MNPPIVSDVLGINIMHFARMLRDSGITISTFQTLRAVEILSFIDIRNRQQVFYSLITIFLSGPEEVKKFELIFDTFWNHSVFDNTSSLGGVNDKIPDSKLTENEQEEILYTQEIKKDSFINLFSSSFSSLGWSNVERLGIEDFSSISDNESKILQDILLQIRIPIPYNKSRRYSSSHLGKRIDLRRSLRSMQSAGELFKISWMKNRHREGKLAVLCDISGSMRSYSRIFIYFIYALSRLNANVNSFLFGTRLTNITNKLRYSDADYAVELIMNSVPDWSGGTRIGEILSRFNTLWSQRVLDDETVVLLITDGLDLDGGKDLSSQMSYLQRSCCKLIWLNPLLRYSNFQPKASGIKAMLPYVDDFRTIHNLKSILELANTFR